MGKIEGKRWKGGPRTDFSDQINEKVKVNSYGEGKELAMDRKEWMTQVKIRSRVGLLNKMIVFCRNHLSNL